jgi:hypothetical protein
MQSLLSGRAGLLAAAARIVPGVLRTQRAIYFPFWIAYDLLSSQQDASFRLKFVPNFAKLDIG